MQKFLETLTRSWLALEAHEHEEALEVNGVKLTEESSLKDPRTACRYLHISKNGAKALVWARLKKEVAMLRLKTSVECSDAVKAGYEREPVAQSLPTKPSPDLVALHEITHIPRQDWCESCAAARSREDAFSSSGDPGRRESPQSPWIGCSLAPLRVLLQRTW